MASEPLLDIPDGKPLAGRLGDVSLNAFGEAAAPAAPQPGGAPPAPPGERAVQHYVDIPAQPGSDR